MTVSAKAPSPFGEGILPSEWQLSAWQRSTRDDPLVNHGRNDPLPESADVVIIGSGLAGAVTAYNLLASDQRPQSIVVLEARETCSGASGRNAGHCRPDGYRGYNDYKKGHGAKQAVDILASEATTLKNVKTFIAKHNVECEFTPRPTVDICLTPEFADYASKAYVDAKEAGVDVSVVSKLDGVKAQADSRAPGAITAFQWPAATLNPAKLCYAVHRECFNQGGYSLFTYAPATSVTPGSRPSSWMVNSTRGTVEANKVIYATNAYSRLILPEFEGLITPCKAQAVQIARPPAGSAAFPKLEPSMSLRYSLDHFYSVAQRPDESIVLCCPATRPGETMQQLEGAWNVMDDSGPTPERTWRCVTGFNKIVPGGGYDLSSQEPGKGAYEYAWSGIVGITLDNMPFIGPVPDKPGQYMIAGFNGHGMARIFHCAPCLANVVLQGMDAWDPDVPTAFQLTPERLQKLQAQAKAAARASELAKASGLNSTTNPVQ